MRARINSIDLINASRKVDFEPGLNIITGPIASGKTTLLRMCHGLFGTGLENFPPEAKEHVAAIAGQLTLGDPIFTIVRPFVSTKNAKVEISGLDSILRLPALQLDATAPYTYGQWLLRTLGLPELRVPSAPTRPESDPTALSINDFFLYCVLAQETIDNAVCGHRDAFKNIKRKYVFEVLYDIYNAEIYNVQERLHDVNSRLSQISAQASSFDRILADTPWGNRAVLFEQLQRARSELQQIEAGTIEERRPTAPPPDIQDLRTEVLRVDEQRAEIRSALEREEVAVAQLNQLIKQLESSSKRLTRTIIAKTYLTDFEFIICPRCGASVDERRGNEGVCNLCLQPPSPKLDRKDFINEQDRLEAQIEETRELISSHVQASVVLNTQADNLARQRQRNGRELDFRMAAFVSDSATMIANAASKRPAALATVTRLEDYLRLYEKLDALVNDRARLEKDKAELEGTLEILSTRQDTTEARIRTLEANFEDSLQRLGVPRFSDPPRAMIDRVTYLPILDGRRFDDLSSQGLQVLVNVAHAIAHQRTAIELDLPLPNILLIDGLTTNVGQEGFDVERMHNAYKYLIAMSNEVGDRLQIIVADGNVPTEAEPFVRLRLSEDDRLIPIG